MSIISYRALIGGCYFSNVPNMIVFDDHPILTVSSVGATARPGIYAELRDSAGTLFGQVKDSKIDLIDRSRYHVHEIGSRASVIDGTNGFIILDLIQQPTRAKLDFILSATLHLPNGVPIFLHPNRIRIGTARILKPNMMSLRLAAKSGQGRTAMNIELDPAGIPQDSFQVPRSPMVGVTPMVQRLLDTDSPISAEIATLLFEGQPGTAAINMSGACYLLDVAFTDFEVGITLHLAKRAVKEQLK